MKKLKTKKNNEREHSKQMCCLQMGNNNQYKQWLSALKGAIENENKEQVLQIIEELLENLKDQVKRKLREIKKFVNEGDWKGVEGVYQELKEISKKIILGNRNPCNSD